MPLHIEENCLGAFFAHYGQVGEVIRSRSKVGIAMGEVALQVTLMWENFSNIPDVL